MKDWAEVAGVCVLAVLMVVFGLAVFALCLAAVFAFYGAIFGSIGAGIYLTFKWLVALFGGA